MSRNIFDCREWPGPCTLAITGDEDEVVSAQLLHLVRDHGREDSPELRQHIRAALRDAPAEAPR